MKKRISTPVILLCAIVSIVALILAMNLIDPNNGEIFGLLLVMVLVYATFFFVTLLFCIMFLRVANFLRLRANDINSQQRQRKLIYVAAALALAPLFTVSLNALGEIQTWYVMLIVFFEVVAIFFIIRRT